MSNESKGFYTPVELQERAYSGAGISYHKEDGYVFLGYDSTGKPLYSNAETARSNDPYAGQQQLATTAGMLKKLGALKGDDLKKFEDMQARVGDINLLQKLYQQKQDGDAKGFVNTFLEGTGLPGVITQEDLNKDGHRRNASAAFQAYQLYTNWDKLSNTQRGLGLARVGLDAYRTATGDNLSAAPIFDPIKDANGKVVIPGLSVGQALNLAGNGYNIYQVAANWKHLSTSAKIVGGANSAQSILSIGKTLGVIDKSGNVVGGAGTKPFAEAGASVDGTSMLGAAYGAGVGAGVVGEFTDNDTAKVGGAVGGGVAGALAPMATGYLGAVYGAYKMGQATQGRGDANSRMAGGVGGATAVTGLMIAGGPVGWVAGAAIIASGVALGSVKTGKDDEQYRRDEVRSIMKNHAGLTDSPESFTITMPDGSVADIGVDTRDHTRRVTNPDAVGDNKYYTEDGLQSHDVDYTNDLDMVTSLPATALTQLLMGEQEKRTIQMGGQLTNAALGTVGFNADMSEENFNHVMQNLRSLYAKSGVTSKEGMMEIIAAAEESGKFDATAILRMRQSANLLYDEDAYDTAQQLMIGRQRGVEVGQEIANAQNGPEEILDKPPASTVDAGAAVAAVSGQVPDDAAAEAATAAANAMVANSPQDGTLKGKPVEEEFLD